MKKYIIIMVMLFTSRIHSQTTNDILNLLIANKTVTQQEADSIRAENAILQQNTLPDKRLRLDFELRARGEYRNGYNQLRNDTTTPAYFVNQRSRLSANYSFNNRFILQFSVQDLRVWGQQDPRSTSATIQVFEAWAEAYLTNKVSVRIGRQKLVYDNQRLFAENDWRLGGGVHDALNVRYYTPKISSELAMAFNQNAERFFGTDFNPGFTFYKFLAVHYLRIIPNKNLILTTINSTDGYQDSSNPERINFRYTLGGRVEFEKGLFYATFSGYYQGGENSTGKGLSAWYIQPEARITTKSGLIARLGVEVFSGNDNHVSDQTDRSFVPLYGVAHRFNGSMDLIIRFPNDVRGAGLVNPYLYVIQPILKKLEIRSDLHTFSLQQDYYVDNQKINKYLGFENDWLITYRPNQITKIDLGVSYMLPTESFEIIKNSGSSKYTLTWVYVSVTFKPVLFTSNFR